VILPRAPGSGWQKTGRRRFSAVLDPDLVLHAVEPDNEVFEEAVEAEQSAFAGTESGEMRPANRSIGTTQFKVDQAVHDTLGTSETLQFQAHTWNKLYAQAIDVLPREHRIVGARIEAALQEAATPSCCDSDCDHWSMDGYELLCRKVNRREG
jgi:hypothetical protein